MNDKIFQAVDDVLSVLIGVLIWLALVGVGVAAVIGLIRLAFGS